MKPDPMPKLQSLFLKQGFMVAPPVKTRGKPGVMIDPVKTGFVITFRLPKIISGQTFLGIYPAAATLPDPVGLKLGDYALLASGEILQIL
jgi:hypothetical protein